MMEWEKDTARERAPRGDEEQGGPCQDFPGVRDKEMGDGETEATGIPGNS